MAIKKIELENFTVFDKMDIQFTEGINVLIGENGVGKTHVMKLLY
ncbi:AAA family ATPase, partial [Enterocloster lavalensis]